MSAIKKDELKKELNEVMEILLLAQESLKVVKYLSEDEEDEDFHYSKRVNAFFYFSRIIYWRTAVIELAKLFSKKKSERFNIHRFITKLKRDGHYGSLKIPVKKIDAWNKAIGLEETHIENLLLQRDKLYAHTDPSHREVETTLTISSVQRLVGIIQDVIKSVYLEVFESAHLIDDPVNAPIQNLQWVISELARSKKLRESGLKELAKAYGL